MPEHTSLRGKLHVYCVGYSSTVRTITEMPSFTHCKDMKEDPTFKVRGDTYFASPLV